MTNQTDVVVDKVEEGISISNEEADADAAPEATADEPETTDDLVDNTNQTSAAAEEEASPSLPWWKQMRVLISIGVIVVVIVVVAIVLGVTLSSSNSNSSKCFGPDDGGLSGGLFNAVRAYVRQECAINEKCEIGQTYGWPMNSWCVGNVKDMSYMFSGMGTFNEDINGWNTSRVTRMDDMFFSATSFNGDVSNFNTSKVTSMWSMFSGATSFNQDLSNFDTSRVTDMWRMFDGASSFNSDLSSFDLSSVTNLNEMFYGASSFNQDLCSWQDSFPYTNAFDIFTDSGCTYQDTPNETQKGPFCASNCQ